MYLPPIPQTYAQARALAMKIGDARSNPILWDTPVHEWLVKANVPVQRYHIQGHHTFYDTLSELAHDQGITIRDAQHSVKTGKPTSLGKPVEEVLAIDNQIIKILPHCNTDAIKRK